MIFNIFSRISVIARRISDEIAIRRLPFAALTPEQRAVAIAKLTPEQRATAVTNLIARADSNLDLAEGGRSNMCWLTNANTYLELAAEYGYTGGYTGRRLERLRAEYASIEDENNRRLERERADYIALGENHTDVDLLAGPFCHCRDYSCPGPVGACVNY